MRRTRPFVTNHPRRGSALAVLAVSLILIIGVMALALDGGMMMAERRHAQAVADATAYAAAGLLYKNRAADHGLDPHGTSGSLALAIAAGNGYANDVTTSTVTVNIPPRSGTFNGKSGYAEVIVSYNVPKCFSALWGAGAMTVGARTVARGKTKYDFGVILLDPTMPAALSGVGTARLNVPNGTVVVDSSNSSAARFIGSPSGGVTAQTIQITGGTSGGSFVGTVVTGAAPTPDPLTALPAPNVSTMTAQRTTELRLNNSDSVTIDPGVYTGGIRMTGGSLTMMPGIYYINGGGIDTSGGGSITGSGVMIYNGGSTVGSINLAGSSSINLTPPSTGPYAGICIFQDRTATAACSLVGTGGINITGGIYVPKAPTSLVGTSATNVTGSFLIADSASVKGTADINVGTNAGGGVRDLLIVE